MQEHPNYLKKIANAEVLTRLARLRDADLWNATYCDAVNDLCEKGLFITVEPFETRSTKDGIAWYAKYSKVSGDKVYTYETPDCFSTWKDAIETVLIDALDNCLESTVEIKDIEPEKKDYMTSQTDRSVDRIPDEQHAYATEFYGRHTSDDPFPFE